MKQFLSGLLLGIILVPLSTFALSNRMYDVDSSAWYAPSVYKLIALGIIKGYPDGSFRPNNTVSRAELAVILDRTLDTYCFKQMEHAGNCEQVDPEGQIKKMRDAQRRSDVNTILNAVYQYAIDKSGTIPSTIIEGEVKEICRSYAEDCGDLVELHSFLGNAYLVAVPSDPLLQKDQPETGYTITVSSDGRVTVAAPYAETGPIHVTR